MISKISPRPARANRHGFTLVELLAVIGIVAVLAGLSLPVISNVKESGNSARCIGNLKQIGTALDLYANDNDNKFPPLVVTGGPDWDFGSILPYLPGRNRVGSTGQIENNVFVCPSAKYTGYASANISRTYASAESMIGPDATGGYTVWSNQRRRTNLASMTNTLLLFDAVQEGTKAYCTLEIPWITLAGSADLQPNAKTSTYIAYRHGKAFNGLFADGHVDKITRQRVATAVTKTVWTGVAQ